MGHNSYGHELTITTFGESHGPALGVVIDGLESDFPIDLCQVEAMMDRRRPGGNSQGTKRNESDKIEVLSGIFNGKSTGSPIALLIRNSGQHSSDYDALKDTYRPGHADYTLEQKWGIRDWRGGGRSSGRETASRVASGAIALQVLEKKGITIKAGTVQMGSVVAESRDWGECVKNPFSCPDARAAKEMEEQLEQARMEGDSLGGVIECRVDGVPAGLGEPTFDKLDAEIGKAFFSIGAVKGVEIGDGFLAARTRGSANNDQMEKGKFLSNHAGGILGGISNGNEIIVRVACKPTPSISIPQQTMKRDGSDTTLVVKGRHDPCVCPRAVVVVVSMMALVILDAWYCQFGRH